MDTELVDAAEALARDLKKLRTRIVLAESCTAGLVAAALARVPGISDWLCGSAVTYRDATKRQWLDVPADDIDRDTSVSESVTRQMATGVLQMTPEAELSAAVTGHLGPASPAGLDGVVFVAFAIRADDGIQSLPVERYGLTEKTRIARQIETARIVLEQSRIALAQAVDR